MNIPRAGSMTSTVFRAMRADGLADFTHPSPNRRPSHCRICRSPIAAGAGHGYDEYMTDGYRFARRYVCAMCMCDMGSPIPTT